MVDFGCVDLHVWTARVDRPDRPDVVLFDLDPTGAPFADVVRAALELRALLEALGLESCPMTTEETVCMFAWRSHADIRTKRCGDSPAR